MLKAVISKVLKGVAAIAGVVALFVPLRTFDEDLIFFGSIAVIVVCLIAWSELDDDHGSVSFWPPKPNK
jgi:uncharacterized membrane protein HdeD (DUF308 family)